MRIGELSQRTSVSRDTIRFYERSGLIGSRPSGSRTNSYRDYPEQTALTLELIREAQAAGFTLDELRTFIAQLESAPSDGFDGEAFLEEKIRDVEQTIRRSKRFLRTLRMAKQALEARR